MSVRAGSILFVVAASVSLHSAAWAQPVSVTHHDGLLSIQCKDAPLSSIFGLIEKEAGVELVLEDEVKSKRLTANLTDVPVAMAVQRLLEGAGVNYVVMMDPANWARVGKIFVGAGGGGPARSAQASRGPVALEPPEPDEVYEETVDGVDPMNSGNFPQDATEGPDVETPPDAGEFGGQNPGAQNPPGSSPIPDFFGQQQSFPRSNFTPGPGNTRSFGQQQQTQPQTQPQNPSAAPPATFPFTDPFGRPIPIPPEMNPQQQQPPQQQQQKKQQQRQQ